MFGSGRGPIPQGARMFMDSSYTSTASSSSNIISGLSAFGDDGSQLSALQQLNDLLTMGQSNRVTQFIPPLIQIVHQSSLNPELTLQSIRALNQIIDIEPGCTTQLVSNGLIPALCGRLLDISDFEVAEQCMKNLHLLSQHYPKELLKQGALKACLAFFDFFPNHLQRTASITAANITKDISRCTYDDVVQIIDFLPLLNQCLASANDEQALQNLCVCYSRLVSGLTQQINMGEHGSKKSLAFRPSLSQRSQTVLQKFVGKIESAAYAISKEKEANKKDAPNDTLETSSSSSNDKSAKERLKKRSSSHHQQSQSQLFDLEIDGAKHDEASVSKDDIDSAKDIFLESTSNMNNWRVRLLRKVGSEPAIMFLLNLARHTLQGSVGSAHDSGKPGIDHSTASNILSSIARILRVSPQFIPVVVKHGILELVQYQLDELSASDSALLAHQYESQVADSLRLCQALLPHPPSSSDFAPGGLLGDDDSILKFESSLIFSNSEDHKESSQSFEGNSNTKNNQESLPSSTSSSGTPVAAVASSAMESELDGIVFDDETGEKVWSCPKCTFHNPFHAPTCDICGEVSPVVKARVNTSKTPEKNVQSTDSKSENADANANAFQDALPLEEEEKPLTIEQVLRKDPSILESLSKSILGPLMRIISSSSSKDLQSRALSVVSSLLYISPKELLVSTYRDLLAPGKVHHHSALYACLKPGSDNPHVVGSAIRLIMLLVWRLSNSSEVNILYDLMRDGIVSLIESLPSRFDFDLSKKSIHQQGDRVESLSRRVALLSNRIHSLNEKLRKDTEDAVEKRMTKLNDLSNKIKMFAPHKSDLSLTESVGDQPPVQKDEDLFSRESDKFSPAHKKFRLVGGEMKSDAKGEYMETDSDGDDELLALNELCDLIISDEGITVHELIESGIISSLHGFLFGAKQEEQQKKSNKRDVSPGRSSTLPQDLSSDKNRSIARYFQSPSKGSATEDNAKANSSIIQQRGRALIEKIHEVFNSCESLKIIHHGYGPADSARLLDSSVQILMKPSKSSLQSISKLLKKHKGLGKESYKIKSQDFYHPVLVAPLNALESLESSAWSKLQKQLMQLPPKSSSLSSASAKKPEPSYTSYDNTFQDEALAASSLSPNPTSKNYFRYLDDHASDDDNAAASSSSSSQAANTEKSEFFVDFSKLSNPLKEVRDEFLKELKKTHLTIGMNVVRGFDWKYGDQDGGSGSVGIVIGLKPWSKYESVSSASSVSESDAGVGVIVEWSSDSKTVRNIYRWNINDCFDVVPAPSINKQSSSVSTTTTSSSTLPQRRYAIYGAGRSGNNDYWRQSLMEGSFIDALDINQCWRHGLILKISHSQHQRKSMYSGEPSPPKFALIAFEGLGATSTEWISVQSQRILPYQSRVPSTPGSSIFDPNSLSVLQADHVRFRKQQSKTLDECYPPRSTIKISNSIRLLIAVNSIIDFVFPSSGKWERGIVTNIEYASAHSDSSSLQAIINTSEDSSKLTKVDLAGTLSSTSSPPPGAPTIGKRTFSSLEGLRKKKSGGNFSPSSASSLSQEANANPKPIPTRMAIQLLGSEEYENIDLSSKKEIDSISRVGLHESTKDIVEKEGLKMMNEVLDAHHASLQMSSAGSIDYSALYSPGTHVYVNLILAKYPIWFKAVVNEFESNTKVIVDIESPNSDKGQNITRKVSVSQLCLSIDDGKFSPSMQEMRDMGYALRELDDIGVQNLSSYLSSFSGASSAGYWSSSLSANRYIQSRDFDEGNANDNYEEDQGEGNEDQEADYNNDEGDQQDDQGNQDNAEEDEDNDNNNRENGDDGNEDNDGQERTHQDNIFLQASSSNASDVNNSNIFAAQEEMDWSKGSISITKSTERQENGNDDEEELTQSKLREIFARSQVPMLPHEFIDGDGPITREAHQSDPSSEESAFFQYLLRRGTLPSEARAAAEQVGLLSSNQQSQAQTSTSSASASASIPQSSSPMGRIAAFFRSSSSGSDTRGPPSLPSSGTSRMQIPINALSSSSSSTAKSERAVPGVPIKLAGLGVYAQINKKKLSVIKAIEKSATDDNKNSLWQNVHIIEYDIDTEHPEWKRVSSPGRLVASSGSFTKMLDGTLYTETRFPTISPLDVKLTKGSWYYEVQVVRAGLAQIGWVDSQFNPNDEGGKGCGDDQHGWAYDGSRIKKWLNGESTAWGSPWKDGDVIGCAVDIRENEKESKLKATMSFSINNDWNSPMGIAFSDAMISDYLLPAITFNNTFRAKMLLYNDDESQSRIHYKPPDGYLPVGDWIRQHSQQAEIEGEGVEEEQEISSSLSQEKASKITRLQNQQESDSLNDENEISNSIGNDISKKALDILQLLGKKSNRVDLGLVEKDFASERLTERYSQQMQDIFAVCTETLPPWCRVVSEKYRICVPFNVRFDYFRTTSFGPSRSLQTILDPSGNGVTSSSSTSARGSRGHDPISYVLSSLSRSGGTTTTSLLTSKKQKVVIPRDRALESAVILFEHIATTMPKPVLSVEFAQETGHGLGPTLEFFSLICLELQRADLGMWRWNECITSSNDKCSGIIRAISRISKSQILRVERDELDSMNRQEQQQSSTSSSTTQAGDDAAMETENEEEEEDQTATTDSSPIPAAKDNSNSNSSKEALEADDQKRYIFNPLGLFPAILRKELVSKDVYEGLIIHSRFFGRFIAKAFMDGRLLDLPLSLPFCKVLLGEQLDLHDVSNIDAELGKSLESLSKMCEMYEQSSDEKEKKKIEDDVSNLCLDFTFPGTGGVVELCENGSDVSVTIQNLQEYLDKVVNTLFIDGVKQQFDAIKSGFNEIFSIEKLRIFSPSELLTLLSGAQQESWDRETISKNIVCQKYNLQSPQIQTLITIMTEFNEDERRLFLKFCTGAPRLPIGGWAKLKPPLTITRKDPIGDTKVNDMLPSCSTCQVYLKLPEYTAGKMEIMKPKVMYAIQEGQEHFDFD